ncbi:MAG: hypothetical protein COC22_04065 [Flavobacteriaceae bacterium]|nr:MAG: hypothetical protein COC22_04065 [Flavobacteriaceae bacterium]
MVIKKFLVIMVLPLSMYLNPSNTNDLHNEVKPSDDYKVPFVIQSNLTLGYSNVIALIKWFKFMNYFGGTEHDKLDGSFMLQQVEEITALNPNHKASYSIAATVLPWIMETSEPSETLLNKAARQFPQDWQWPFYMGFNAYWFDHDRKKSIHYLTQAAALVDAPSIVMGLALRMQSDTGEFDTALMFIDSQINNAPDVTMQKQLAQHRTAILTERKLYNIELLLNKYYPNENKQQAIQKLAQKGYHIPKILPDGGHIIFKKDDTIASSQTKKRFKIFIPVKRQGVIQHESTH